ncbi:unnamed protein product [Dicrocoelium dendriticum]|nr:unnamed protein product [Dicrocoelium dendriticum]
MVQELSIVSDPVMLHIWSCLHNYAYEDAIFAAERLYAETHSSESLYLLATSLYRIGRPKQVCRLLLSGVPLSPKSRYLLAKCYSEFGSLNEAEEALLGHSLSSRPLDEVASLYNEQAGYAILLLGDIQRRQGRLRDASQCYKKSLELNPMLWSAFKNLCDIGELPNPALAFQLHDGLALPTATYRLLNHTVVGGSDQNIPSQAVQDRDQSAVEICRENLNPDKSSTKTMLSSTGLREKPCADYLDTTHNRAYVTHFSNSVTACESKGLESMQTPQINMSTSNVPMAPKPKPTLRELSGSLFSGRELDLDIRSLSPKFGALALLSQSPMFACVPVFHKRSIVPAASENILSNSLRYGNYQSAPLRPCGQNGSIGPATGGTRSIITSPVSSTNVRRRSKNSNSDPLFEPAPPAHNTRIDVISKSDSPIHCTPEQTVTSTPACLADSLRKLVSPISTTSFLGLPTSHASSETDSGSPAHRCGHPLLRSSGHRTVVSLGSSDLTPRSTLQLLNASSPTAGALSVSTAGHPAPRTNSGSATDECQPVGPRTRSQVAAAAAVARASGIQRRSNRTIRGKGFSKNSGPPNISSRDTPVQIRSKRVTTPDREFYSECYATERSPGSFGLHPHSCDLVSVEVPVSTAEDPRVTSLQNYLKLLRHLGKAYQFFVQHDWRSATRLLCSLPPAQLATGRVLAWAARAHMDSAEYSKAQKLFNEARMVEPWQLVGMDFYSTVLWQLQADHDLSNLAHELLELDRNAPEPWCAAGNCFSLHGEHEVAVRFFQRAIQVCPTSVYAFTLLGHELSTLEEFDRAVNAFRHALRLDPRHYNALFGISNVYYKQEKFELAETHLTRAVALFPHSHLLLANLGALRGRLGHLDDGPDSALALVTKACKLQPNNPLARYHRSSILFHLGRYPEVLVELQKLLVLTPREAMVYLMIGHTYKKMGNTPQAMIHYSWAMGLDPKGANTHLRDIMTNPPVVGHSLSSRRETMGVENGALSSTRTTRSRLATVPDDAQPEAEEAGDDRPSLPESSFGDPDVQLTTDETMDRIFHSDQFNSSNATQSRAARHLLDLSFLYDAEDYDDAALSATEDADDHYETMDLSGEVEDGSSHSVTDD